MSSDILNAIYEAIPIAPIGHGVQKIEIIDSAAEALDRESLSPGTVTKYLKKIRKGHATIVMDNLTSLGLGYQYRETRDPAEIGHYHSRINRDASSRVEVGNAIAEREREALGYEYDKGIIDATFPKPIEPPRDDDSE